MFAATWFGHLRPQATRETTRRVPFRGAFASVSRSCLAAWRPLARRAYCSLTEGKKLSADETTAQASQQPSPARSPRSLLFGFSRRVSRRSRRVARRLVSSRLVSSRLVVSGYGSLVALCFAAYAALLVLPASGLLALVLAFALVPRAARTRDLPDFSLPGATRDIPFVSVEPRAARSGDLPDFRLPARASRCYPSPGP
jgi:hypothetical protein